MTKSESAPCPFCGLRGGFHEEEAHDAIPLPADRVIISTRRQMSSVGVCPNPNCQRSYDGPGANGCRNPKHSV